MDASLAAMRLERIDLFFLHSNIHRDGFTYAFGDSAKAQFYPNINLTAFAGFSSIGFDKLVQSSSAQWGVGLDVVLETPVSSEVTQVLH